MFLVNSHLWLESLQFASSIHHEVIHDTPPPESKESISLSVGNFELWSNLLLCSFHLVAFMFYTFMRNKIQARMKVTFFFLCSNCNKSVRVAPTVSDFWCVKSLASHLSKRDTTRALQMVTGLFYWVSNKTFPSRLAGRKRQTSRMTGVGGWTSWEHKSRFESETHVELFLLPSGFFHLPFAQSEQNTKTNEEAWCSDGALFCSVAAKPTVLRCG